MAVLPTGIGPVTGYNIERSLRFNSADSAYLNRTPGSTGNRKTWTFSFWFKQGLISDNVIFGSRNAGATYVSYIGFQSNKFDFQFGATGNRLQDAAVRRDPGAWAHYVVVCDTPNATSTNRMQLWVNGVRVTTFTTASYPSQNADSDFNVTDVHAIGRYGAQAAQYVDGYLTEMNFIDGQALTPSDFGETDSATGVWKPKAYSGTYGTNGFYLKFADNSGTTSTTLGKDSSGNGNNWTPNNFSVTAGAGNDSMVDSPTAYGTDTGVGGTVRGNYCTWNPTIAASTGVGTLSNGNLQCVTPTSGASNNYGTIGMSSGKWYWEVTIDARTTDSHVMIGINNNTQSATEFYSQANGYAYRGNGEKWNNGSGVAYGSSAAIGAVIGVAFDADAGSIVFYKDGVSMGTAFTSIPASTYFLAICDTGTSINWTATANFGQRAFAYTAPSGFKALCTTNLPTPTIGATSTTQANDYFDATLYTGTGATQSITNSGSMQPDFVWVKNRSVASNNRLVDAVRGVSAVLFSNTTDAESTDSLGVTALNTGGFTVGTSSGFNNSSNAYIAWQWNAGGSNATNTSGTITSTVRANTTSGFSIVTYTGTGVNATVGHGLGVAPSMIIIKNRTAPSGYNWNVYHASIGNTQRLFLDSTSAQASGVWNNTSPTSTVFTIAGAAVYNNGDAYVAYCFAPVAGYSAFGSYTGNGSTDGPFVYTNFRPRWIMFKSTNGTNKSWWIADTSRSPYNVVGNLLAPNASDAEVTGNPFVDYVSNGFKLRDSWGGANTNGEIYIYAAFAESPFKYSLAR